MSKGQVVNIDYAVAAGIFIVGFVAALGLTFNIYGSQISGFENSLESEAYSISEIFSEEVSWEIKALNVGFPEEAENTEFLVVVDSEQKSDTLVTSGETLIDFERFGDKVVFQANNTSARVLTSDRELENITKSGSQTLSSNNYSNSKIDVSFDNSGLTGYTFDGVEMMNSLDLSGSGVSTTEKEVAAELDYGQQQIYFFSNEQDLYLDTMESSDAEFPSGFDTLEVIGGSTYSLDSSVDLSTSNPVLLYNDSAGVAITGPSISMNVTDSGAGSPTLIELKDSYYISGFRKNETGRERARLSQDLYSEVETPLEGVSRDDAEDLFNESEYVFTNRLRISSPYNINFDSMVRGGSLPQGSSIVARSFSKNMLERNGSFSEANLEVRVWR